MSSIKKIVLGFAAFAMMAMGAAPAMSMAATTLQHGNSLGDTLILNKLFSGDRILGNSISGKASLGNLLILDQLFPKTATTTVTTVTTARTTTTVTPISLAERLEGKILIQVQGSGQAWYDNPLTDQRVFLGPTPTDAFNAMAKLAVGVSNAKFDSFNGKAPTSLSGRFIIKPEDAGKLYYVSPTDRSINFIDGPNGALSIIQTFGMGITNADLAKISVQ